MAAIGSEELSGTIFTFSAWEYLRGIGCPYRWIENLMVNGLVYHHHHHQPYLVSFELYGGGFCQLLPIGV